MNDHPPFVSKRAIDITPCTHALWCSIGDGEPFVNPIVSRKWSEDGKSIWFMLDSHNFMNARPNEIPDCIVETPSIYHAELMDRVLKRDAEEMSKHPRDPYAMCSGRGEGACAPAHAGEKGREGR